MSTLDGDSICSHIAVIVVPDFMLPQTGITIFELREPRLVEMVRCDLGTL